MANKHKDLAFVFAHYDEAEGGCWEWNGTRWSSGYGRCLRNRQAHRVAWEAVNGPIPDGLLVCHRCDNRPCIRPDHLFLGTQHNNLMDASAKHRLLFGDRNHMRRRPDLVEAFRLIAKRPRTSKQIEAARNAGRAFKGKRQSDAHRAKRSVAVSGEKNGSAKLSESQASEILRRVRAGEARTSLAHEYGVSTSTVGAIARGDKWRAVPYRVTG